MISVTGISLNSSEFQKNNSIAIESESEILSKMSKQEENVNSRVYNKERPLMTLQRKNSPKIWVKKSEVNSVVSNESNHWPTLGESQEISQKKRSNITIPSTKPSFSSDSPLSKSRKSKKGVPISPEKQQEMFGLERTRYKGGYHHSRSRSAVNVAGVPLKPNTNSNRYHNRSKSSSYSNTQSNTNNGTNTNGSSNNQKNSSNPNNTYATQSSLSYTAVPYPQPQPHVAPYALPMMHHQYPMVQIPFHHPAYQTMPHLYPTYPQPHPHAMHYPYTYHLGYYGHPGMSLYPQPDPASKEQLVGALRKQIEYYFSIKNLDKDKYLRAKMDDDGWIPLAVVANFNRVRMLTFDPYLIIESLIESEAIEISQDSSYIRVKDNYEKWVLPAEERELVHLPASYVSEISDISDEQASSSTSSAHIISVDDQIERVSIDEEEKGNECVSNDIALVKFDYPLVKKQWGDEAEDEEYEKSIIYEKNKTDENVFELEKQSVINPNSSPLYSEFTDENLDRRLVIVIPEQSNYSSLQFKIDETLSVLLSEGLAFYENQINHQENTKSSKPNCHFYLDNSVQKEKIMQDDIVFPSYIGWFLGASSEMNMGYENNCSTTSINPFIPFPCIEHPSYNILSGFKIINYNAFYEQCLKEREICANTGHMKSLYKFWSMFLVEHFNIQMYENFKFLAWNDALQGSRFGLECLFKFYNSGLEKTFRDNIYQDFEEFTLKDYESGYTYGLERFSSFIQYGCIPLYSSVQTNENLKDLLTKFCSTFADIRQDDNKKIKDSSNSSSRKNSLGASSTTSSSSDDHFNEISPVTDAKPVLIHQQTESLSVA